MLICETARLIVRKFTIDDAQFICSLLNSPTWIQFLGDRNIQTVADAQQYLTNGPLASYALRGFGLYLVAMKDSGVPIGMSGLIKRDGLEYVDVGFALLPEYMGQGYAYEATKAVMDYGYNTLQLPHIVAIARADNKNSLALLAKLGLKFSETVMLAGIEHPLSLFK
ncbi:GNAT family N-acetyltransferase [Chitinophaga sancti]|uniref:GNAT family N-acetyltransferase n=1 Tax=Chitinophaga sancti TaxID=1004 RepID=UPI002A760296|nr:GNAT family N-acetyltransferase [Chitinophaga sancti]WPQ65903.1 GNAT family N-acetyltransferase [Chitinophaga sancti]